MPADSPSMLSSRLKAFVMPTIHTSDNSDVDDDDAGDVSGRHQIDHDSGHDGLHDELRRRTEMQDIVERAEPEHQSRGHEQGHERRKWRRERRGDGKRERDGAAAEERNRLTVPAIVVGVGQKPAPARERAHQWRQHCRKRQRGKQREKCGSDFHRSERVAERVEHSTVQVLTEDTPSRRRRTVSKALQLALHPSLDAIDQAGHAVQQSVAAAGAPLTSLNRLPSKAECCLKKVLSSVAPSSA